MKIKEVVNAVNSLYKDELNADQENVVNDVYDGDLYIASKDLIVELFIENGGVLPELDTIDSDLYTVWRYLLRHKKGLIGWKYINQKPRG